MKEFSRYERQFILKGIGREGQRLLDESKVAVIGIGALGSVTANLLARAGIGHLTLMDRDFLEINNLQRQVLYDEKDIAENLPKAVAAQKKLIQANSEITITAEVTDLNSSNIEALLQGYDLIIDGTDNFETRFLINDYCLKNKIPWIYGGAVSTEGMSFVILPGKGPCLRCLFGESPGPENAQTCDQVGILASVAHLVASFQATEAIKILAGKMDAVERKLWKVDLWSRQFQAISVEHLREFPCSGCREQSYPYLERKIASRAVTLCGRNAVQIYQTGPQKIDFEILARKLEGQAAVKFNDYLLNVHLAPYEITVFKNGRAIVRGTEDAGQAKSLYARYIGG
ncbi:MAG: ThiF family adenylyltransferase [Candidatus Omnitrophica bacterium]|nr:ThiF family adenylyltransferase [Candidatus Omnitrophota bacterium]